MKIREFKKGLNETYLLVKKIEEKKTKPGDLYLSMELTDGESNIVAKQWSTSLIDTMAKQSIIVYVSIEVGTYNNMPDYTIRQLRPASDTEGISYSQFIKSAPIEPNTMYQAIVSDISSIDNDDMKRLTLNILENNKSNLLKWSAAKMIHHNMRGGLLYHMYRMVRSVGDWQKTYPLANRDLLICGATLHDIGKLIELITNDLGDAEYTTNGMLFGHLLIGADMVKEAGEKLNTDPEVIRTLRHIIISHHGTLEHEAIKTPCMFEAEIIHYFDMLDSRSYQYEQLIATTEPGEFTSEKVFGLNNQRIYIQNL